MKNILRRVRDASVLISASILVPMIAHGAEFGTSTASTVYTQFQSDVAIIIGAVVGGLLALMGALIGLGWATRKFKHYVSGRKF